MPSQNDRKMQQDPIIREQLSNGLTVILMPTGVLPLVAVDIWYKVGSKDEQPGKSGFAHLFEHMMFQGSDNVAKAEHMKLITDIGGMVNGSTNKDRTNYFEVVPKNQLRLALWLEADRMRSLAVTPENFANQLDAVIEERRLRVDNAPYAPVFYELMDDFCFDNWPYKHSLIGSMEDLNNAQLDDVRKFHDTYYKPNNAVMAIAGDIDPQATMALVREYFEDIPAGPPPPRADLKEPRKTAMRRMVYHDKFAPLPAYLCSHHIPGRTHRDCDVLEIIEKMLFDGESSRIHRRFVEQEQTLLHIFGGADAKLGAGLFTFFGQLKPGIAMTDIAAGYQQELQRICNEPVGDAELQKVKNILQTDFVSKLEKVQYKADLLCYYTVFFDDPKMIYSEIDRLNAVTAADIQRVAKTYFKDDSRCEIEIYPNSSEK